MLKYSFCWMASDGVISSSESMLSSKSHVQHNSELVLPEWDTVPPEEASEHNLDIGADFMKTDSMKIQSDQALCTEDLEKASDIPDCGGKSNDYTTLSAETKTERDQESASNRQSSSKEKELESTSSPRDSNSKGKNHKSAGGTNDEKGQASTSKSECDFNKESLVFQVCFFLPHS